MFSVVGARINFDRFLSPLEIQRSANVCKSSTYVSGERQRSVKKSVCIVVPATQWRDFDVDIAIVAGKDRDQRATPALG